MKRRIIILLLTGLLGTFVSGLLLLQHYNEAHAVSLVSMMCGGETVSGCSAVNRSEYAVFAGVPLAAYGLLFYLSVSLFLCLASVADTKTQEMSMGLIFFIVSVALLIDFILLGIQAFSLKTFCILCLVTYTLTVVLLIGTFPFRRNVRRGTFQENTQQPGRRVIITSWLVGTVVLAFAVGALNLAMHFQDPATFDNRLDQIAYDEYQQSPLKNIDVQGIPLEGPENAPIKIVLYSDFLCPWCRQIAMTIQQHIKRWDPNVAVYFKAYPLDELCNPYEKKNTHPGACWAALGALCAQEQGLFWEYHDRIFTLPPRNPRPQDILKIGTDIGLDTTRMKQCLLSLPMRGKVHLQVEDGRAMGVTGTPGIFINGKKLPRIGYFNSVLSMEAKRLGIQLVNATAE